MKRHFSEDEDDCSVPRKRRKCESVTPISGVIDLVYLYGLKTYVFEQQPFSFCLQKGMAVADSHCPYCPPYSKSKNQENEKSAMQAFKKLSDTEDSNYLAYAIIKELFNPGDASQIDVTRMNGNIQLEVKDVRHLSPFFVHLLLMKEFAEDIRLSLRTKKMTIVCKKKYIEQDNDDMRCDEILNGLITKMKRNALTLTRQHELEHFL